MLSNSQFRAQCQEQLLAYGAKHQYTYTAFEIIFHFSSAYAGYDLLHLDGIIQKAVVDDVMAGMKLPESSHPYEIPIPLEIVWKSESGVPLYNSTSLFPEGKFLKKVSWWVKRNDELGPRFATRKRDGTWWQPDGGTGTYKEYRMPLPTTGTRAIVGYGVGDILEIRRLLSSFVALGKKIGVGFGQVTHFEINPCNMQHRYAFLRDGELLRPVPLAAMGDLQLAPAQGAMPRQIAFSPPYWLAFHQAKCFDERICVKSSSAYVMFPKQEETQSIADFLHKCEGYEFRRNAGDITLVHAKMQRGKGRGELCALSGLPIVANGAVTARDILSNSMGNVVDFLKAPDSHWISNEAAIIMSQPRKFHRNLVALISPDSTDGWLLWPTIALDPDHPQQARPLWREIVLDCVEKYLGWQCVLIFKDEPKSRTWPRARIGTIGDRTPLLFSDFDKRGWGMSDLLMIDIHETKRQMLKIESWLDAGYSRSALQTGNISASAENLIEAVTIQKQLEVMRHTHEFIIAWRIARSKEERDLREGKKA